MSADPRVLSERYRVDELIGRGGMATVYRGQDLTLGRQVAIKILKRELAEDSAFRTRFRLEAQSASRMSHPAIVRVYDAGEDAETDPDGSTHPVPYIVMELVEGTLLKDVVSDGGVPVGDAIRYVDGILEALEYSHRAGVVHRDIKPGNVMITPGGQVKVMDFGIARAVSDSSSTVAETTAIIGTAAYLSPEQAKGEPVDARAEKGDGSPAKGNAPSCQTRDVVPWRSCGASATVAPNATPSTWWPRHTPIRGMRAEAAARTTSIEAPASSGEPGPGEISTPAYGAITATGSSTASASTMSVVAPSSCR